MRIPTVKVMFHMSPISRAWVLSIFRPFVVALLVLMGVASLLLTVQLILRAPFPPSPMGMVQIWLSLFPETLAMLAPAALLLAVVVSSRHWVESGDMRALLTSGVGGRSLVRPTLLFGVLVAMLVALCTQVLAPMGRASARHTLQEAAQNTHVRPGPLRNIGNVWVRVGTQRSDGVGDVTIIADDYVVWAPRAVQMAPLTLQMMNGRARDLNQKWSMQFDSATVTLHPDGLGEHNFERSFQQMRARIAQMESNGRDAFRERLTLYKRSTLPLIVPFLGIVGLPVGSRWRKPYLSTVLVVLFVWVLQRLGDHGAAEWGPELMAVLPFMSVLILIFIVYARWAER